MSCSLSSVFLERLVACCRCFLTHVVLRVELNPFVYEVLLTSTIPIPSKWIIYPTSGIIYDPVNQHPLNKFPLAVQDLWRDSTPPLPKKGMDSEPPKGSPVISPTYLWSAGSRLKVERLGPSGPKPVLHYPPPKAHPPGHDIPTGHGNTPLPSVATYSPGPAMTSMDRGLKEPSEHLGVQLRRVFKGKKHHHHHHPCGVPQN